MDGEGTFGLYGVTGSNTSAVTRQPIVQAAQCNPAPLLRLTLVFGGAVRMSGATAKGTPMHIWRVSGASNIVRCIEKLLPYLTIKRIEAEIVRDYCLLMNQRGRRMSDEQLAARAVLIAKFADVRAA